MSLQLVHYGIEDAAHLSSSEELSLILEELSAARDMSQHNNQLLQHAQALGASLSMQ